MTIEIESAWPKYPGYRIDLEPCRAVGRVTLDGSVLAESDACLRVRETKHVDRLYFPESSVRWERFEPTDLHTICPFKGQADYWTLHGDGRTEENVVWTYRDPFPEVAGIEGYVCFFEDRLTVTLDEEWPDGSVVTTRFPTWGDAAELVRLMDVELVGSGARVVGPPTGGTIATSSRPGSCSARRSSPCRRPCPTTWSRSGRWCSARPWSFYQPVDLVVDVPRGGRRSRPCRCASVRTARPAARAC